VSLDHSSSVPAESGTDLWHLLLVLFLSKWCLHSENSRHVTPPQPTAHNMSTQQAQRRIQVLSKHLGNTSISSSESPVIQRQFTSKSRGPPKSDDDIVIIAPCRTAVGRARRGATKDASAEQLLTPVLKAVIERSGIDPKLIDEVLIGKVLEMSLLGANQVRIASLLAGIPDTASCSTVNRQCSSGLQSVASAAAAIKAGQYDIAIAGGVESMSKGSPEVPTMWNDRKIPEAINDKNARDVYLPMLVTSENVAAHYKISRERQDEVSAESHRRAAEAIKKGLFKEEIVPVELKVKDKDGTERTVVFDTDEGVRAGTTKENLGKLKPIISKPGCSTTAGNASQVSDGAAAMLVMKRSTARKLGLEDKVRGSFLSFVSVGVPPREMGIGPAVAIPIALKKAGVSVDDIDAFEINEAFASQYIYCADKLGLDLKKVNKRGGAIALGHPLGMTGSRQITTLLNTLRDEDQSLGVVSMCVGSGMGAAAVLRRE